MLKWIYKTLSFSTKSLFTFLFIGMFTFLLSCTKGGDDFSNLDSSGSVNKEGVGRCSIKEISPLNTSDVKVSGLSLGEKVFSVVTEGSDCKVKFYLNGSDEPILEGSASLTLSSADVLAGKNELRVEVTGPIGSDFKEWTVIKNELPICSYVSPSVPNLNATEGTQPTLTVSATVQTGESPTFTWLVNGQASSKLIKVIEGSGASQYQLNTTGLTSGIYEVSSVVSDGVDQVTCSYSVNVGPDCALSGKLPDVASLKLASSSGNQTFSVSSATPTCIVSWTVNGTPITGTGLSRAVSSSELLTGSNILKAIVVSTSGTSEQLWTVVKNAVPSCASSPTGTVQLSAGSNVLLQSLLTDTDSDALTWSWKLNGVVSSAPLLVTVDGVNQSTGTFSPTDSNLGFNTVSILINDGYDSVTCSWSVQVNPACAIASKTPDSSSHTVANSATTQNIFAVSSTASSCNVSWELGVFNLGSSLTLQTLMSSSFLSTPNTLKVTVGNASSSQTHTWTVTKNSLPFCASQTPATSGFVSGVGALAQFDLGVTDSDVAQTHNFTWKLDGSALPIGFTSPESTTTSTRVGWIPSSSQAGSHNLSVEVNDGFDTKVCSWSTTILPNCSVTDASPAGTTLKVSYAPTNQTSFAAVPNDSSCLVSWSIDGISVGTGSFNNIESSALKDNNSTNTVTATLANATSSVTRNWTVTKNSPPVCLSQSPLTPTSLNLGETLSMQGTFQNTDSDTLNFSWGLGGSSAAFSGISNNATQGFSTFTPEISHVGVSNAIKLTANDGYDQASCDWSTTVIDPNGATILGHNPVADPVILLSTGSVDLSVVATGTGITYAWYVDSALQPTRTAAIETFNYTQLTAGVHQIKVVVSDTYGGADEHIFNVKRNTKPVIGSYSPNESGVTQFRVGVEGSLALSVGASDADGDSLTYNWLLDGSSHSAIVASTSSASLTPSGNSLLIGQHSLSVQVSDTYETSTVTWSVQVNYFSDECNILFNSSSTGPNAGKGCTLVGNPSMGDGEAVFSDLSLLKFRPKDIIALEPNVYAISDFLNHTVLVANNSGSTKVYFNKTIPHQSIKVVLGAGSRGLSNNASSFVDAFNATSGAPIFKLWSPSNLLYDQTTQTLFISDSHNLRVLALNNLGKVKRVLGLADRGNSNAIALSEGLGNSVDCLSPNGLAINQEGASRYLYVACTNRHVVRKVDITSFTGLNEPNFSTVIAVGRHNTTVSGVAAHFSGKGGATNTPATGGMARLNNPVSLFSHGGLVYISDSHRIHVYNPTLDTREIYPQISTYPSDFASNGSLSLVARSLQESPAWENDTGQTHSSTVLSTNTVNAYALFKGSVLTKGACHLGVIQVKNGATPVKVASDTNINITADEAALYSNSDCSSAATNNLSVTVKAGASLVPFWLKNTDGGFSLTAPVASALTFSNESSVAADYSVTTSANQSDVLECVPVEVRLSTTAAAAPINPSNTVYLSMMTNNFGSYFGDANCLTLIPDQRISFTSGQIAVKTFYYSRKVFSQPSNLTPIFGYAHSAAGFAPAPSPVFTPAPAVNIYTQFSTSYDNSSIAKLGSSYLSTNTLYAYSGYMPYGFNMIPYGNQSLSGFNYPEGIIYVPTVNNWGSSGVNFLNLSPSAQTFGVLGVHAHSTKKIAGGTSGTANYQNYAAGYNGEDNLAQFSTLNYPYGLLLDSAGDLLIADHNNYRIRKIEMSGSSYIREFLGLGQTREIANQLNSEAKSAYLATPFKLDYFGDYLYFSETTNDRIRKVSLTTGIVSGVAGNGSSASYTEGGDALAEKMTNPKGFKVIPWNSGTNLLDRLAPTNYVLLYTEDCMVRVSNISGPTISSFFGVSNLGSGKTKTLAGDPFVVCYNAGNGPWRAGLNTNGMDAHSARFRTVYDVAYLKNKILIIDNTDSCLTQINFDGTLQEVTEGSCGFGVSSEGEAGTAYKSRTPFAFGVDASFPDNLFMTDLASVANLVGKITYFNSTLTERVFSGGGITGYGTSNLARGSYIYDVSVPSGLASSSGGVTSWAQTQSTVNSNDKICWSTGSYDSWLYSNIHGYQNAYCAIRSNVDAGSVAVGPQAGFGSGAPLGREQEGLSRYNMTFYGPTGIAFDQEGNLYLSDSGNHIIRMIRRWW